jgi:hypothetical protein
MGDTAATTDVWAIATLGVFMQVIGFNRIRLKPQIRIFMAGSVQAIDGEISTSNAVVG